MNPSICRTNVIAIWLRDRRTSETSIPEFRSNGDHHLADVLKSGVNFINILRSAFTGVDPKSAKKTVKLAIFFALLGSAFVKAACRMLMKLTPGADEIN